MLGGAEVGLFVGTVLEPSIGETVRVAGSMFGPDGLLSQIITGPDGLSET